MKRIAALTILVGALALPFAASAADGSRQAAGGAHMSSFIKDPHHDPRSLHSQRTGAGQILGAPMIHENAGAHRVRGRLVDPHWATGSVGRRSR